MIDQETPTTFCRTTLSSKAKGANIDIARRTVAKYRESLRIPSSVERRRAKLAQARMTTN